MVKIMKGKEQIYTIPLGKAYNYKKSRRTIRAIDLIRAFVFRHTKADNVLISMKTNEAIWSRSIEKPPRKIKVKVIKEDGTSTVYLPDENSEKKLEEKKEKQKDEKNKTEKKATETVKKEDKKIADKPKEKETQKDAQKIVENKNENKDKPKIEDKKE